MHVLAGDLAVFDSLLGCFLKGEGLVSSPKSLEVSLLVGSVLNLVRIDDLVLVQHLWGALSQHQVKFFKLLSSFFSGCVHSENQWVVLVCLGEGVEFFFNIIDVTLLSNPQWLGHLIVEES